MPSGVRDIQLLELKDTISQLNKTISTQNELISSLQKMLEERNAKDSEKDLLIANLQSQLAYNNHSNQREYRKNTEHQGSCNQPTL